VFAWGHGQTRVAETAMCTKSEPRWSAQIAHC
jgi:hypothetical protein